MAKVAKCKKSYVDGEGGEKKSFFPDATGLTFRFVSGEAETINPNDFPEPIRVAAMWHGFSQKLGDTYAGKTGEDAVEAFLSMQEQLTAGNWVAEGESAGPRISLIVDAIIAAKAKAGITLEASAVAEKYKALDKAGQKDIREAPAVAAEYERIKAEKAMERADKAAAKAESAESADFDF